MTQRRTAILIVNGFDRRTSSPDEALRFPWIELCLRQVERYSRTADLEVLVFDNSQLDDHRRIMANYPSVRVFPTERRTQPVSPFDRSASESGTVAARSHPGALDYLAYQTSADVEFLITMDTDAVPIRDDWIETLTGHVEAGAGVAGVYREEMVPRIRPFVHVSCLCIRRRVFLDLDVSFGRNMSQDVGQNITERLAFLGRRIARLPRTNVRNFHFLIGGVYGDLVYHHGAGSRRAAFWTSKDPVEDERVRVVLRDAAFRDIDYLVGVLQGRIDDDFGLAVC